jgi:hypothetical protein
VRLPPLEGTGKRLTDEQVFAKAEEIAPGVLGALLDCLVHYLKVKHDIENPDVRMVAYAKVGKAVEQALGWENEEDSEEEEESEEGPFMTAYQESRNEANAAALEAFPVAAVLLEYAEDYTDEDRWEGTARELLADLNSRAGETLRRAEKWPRSASELGTQLNKLTTDLKRAGVTFERFHRKGTQLIRLFQIPKS